MNNVKQNKPTSRRERRRLRTAGIKINTADTSARTKFLGLSNFPISSSIRHISNISKEVGANHKE